MFSIVLQEVPKEIKGKADIFFVSYFVLLFILDRLQKHSILV